VAQVVHSPESSPDVPYDDSTDDDDGSPTALPSRVAGRKTTGLKSGDSSANFSPNNSSPVSLTDNEVSKYSFFARLMHYMDGNKISEANRAAMEVCLPVKAGAAVRSMDLMKKEKKEKAFFNKYMGILDKIEDD
jgi:hypothetical protein